jgi:uncharacterized protein YecE (DUF72 family)
VWIGTSGWVYKHWMGIFYPAKMAGSEQLSFYTERFETVEVNYSFYRLPERSVFETWREQSPEGFLFAVKGSRYLTHMKKLKDPEEPLQRLMERATGLGDKLGPILFQFPHTWKANVDRLRAFFDALEACKGQRFAFEFRDASWLTSEVYGMLERAGAALCLPVHPTMPLDPRLTTAWTYIRFHTGQYGMGFTDAELQPWAERLRQYRGDGVESYVYFNNDPGGHALDDAGRLELMLR